MTAPDNKGYGRRFHARYKLRNCQSRLDVASDCVQYNNQPFNSSVLFYRNKSRHYMFVFCGLILRRKNIMSLHLSYNSKAMDKVLCIMRNNLAGFFYQFRTVKTFVRIRSSVFVVFIVVIFFVFIIAIPFLNFFSFSYSEVIVLIPYY